MDDLTKAYPALTESLETAITDIFIEEHDEYGLEQTPNSVSAVAYDGFIPFTNGGWTSHVMRELRNYYEAGKAESGIIEPYHTSSMNDCAEAFIVDNDELAEEFEDEEATPLNWLYNRWSDAEAAHEKQLDLYGVVPFYDTKVGAEREDFYEFETDYMSEGGDYYLQCNALFYAAGNSRNETGEDEVFIFAGVNTDFTYGRDKGLVSTFERTYKLKRLTPARINVIIKAASDSI